MALIAIDLCNTLADMITVIEQVLGPNPNTEYFHPKATTKFFKQNTWVFREAPVISGAVEGVKNLSELGQIIYLTARPENAYSTTLEWLKGHGFPNAPVIHTRDKGEVAMALGITLAIDDAPHEIEKLSKICPVMVHARPYNEGYSGRFTWTDFCLAKGA